VSGLPGWVGIDGNPLSWKHYQYGLQFLRRIKAREQLSLHNAVFMAQAKSEDRQSWKSELEIAAGLRDIG
jgi:hypothetical protein